MAVGGVHVRVRLVLLRLRVQPAECAPEGREEAEGERGQAQDAEDENEGEKPELADAPPSVRARRCPIERQLPR
jgi:hypothetical protein